MRPTPRRNQTKPKYRSDKPRSKVPQKRKTNNDAENATTTAKGKAKAKAEPKPKAQEKSSSRKSKNYFFFHIQNSVGLPQREDLLKAGTPHKTLVIWE